MATFLGLCIAGGLGYLVATDANKRGMNGAAWGICTFLIAILTIPAYLIVRKPLKQS
jgi:hypothetical protein